LVKTKGRKISKGSKSINELNNPSQNERQVGQLKGFFSFLLGNFASKNWKNSCSANENPLIHNADNTVIT
jgi:hypothetical protein